MRAGILGGSGYTGRELIRLLLKHKNITKINTYGRKHGIPLFIEIPEIKGLYDDCVMPIEPEKMISELDVLFMALPHTISMDYAPLFQDKIPIIDLSADYRLYDPENYLKWYGKDHKDPSKLKNYVYGLPELNRFEIKTSKMIANPGCYPTSVILGILPALKAGIIEPDIIIDAKSGHSGAGKKLVERLHASNISNNIQPYKIINHQHIGEIQQVLSSINKSPVDIVFTPYVLPFDRGILSTIYVKLKKPITQEEAHTIYYEQYKDEPCIRIYEEDILPSPKYTAYTNFCDIAFKVHDNKKYLTIISCIDNLIKGASGQAVQNMNIMFGFNEREALFV